MAVALTAFQDTPTTQPVIPFINNGSNGSWNLGGSTISHTNDIGSYSYKTIGSLVIGATYRVTYTISSYTNCNVQVLLGDTAGTVRSSAGTFVEVLVLTGANKRVSFYSTGTATISYYLIEQLVTTVVDTPVDISTMQNNSWTLSFNPILNQWISFHSYLPNNYILHPTKLLAKVNNDQIYLNNSGNYGQFFNGVVKPFIIETIFNEFKIETKVFDSIKVTMDSSTNGGVYDNTFFDSGVVYTENQCSGIISFTINQNVTRKEKDWNFNKFLDISKNIAQKIFVSDWNSVSSSYPIDKVVNVSKIDTTKPWYQRGRMRDKYLAVRLISSNTSQDKFTIKFITSSFRASQR